MPQRRKRSEDSLPPAYKDQELRNRPGEQWEDIPGLDGYFLISNHGRVKRARYETQYRNGAIVIKPEMIKKLRIVESANHYKKDFQHWVIVRAVLQGKTYNFSVGRLVYYCFVRKFDLEDFNLLITYKDNDHFNLRYDNLVLATVSQRRRNTFEVGRALSYFNNPSKDLRKKYLTGIIKRQENYWKENGQKITQFDLAGNIIAHYPSLQHAHLATGVSREISGWCLTEKRRARRGFSGKKDIFELHGTFPGILPVMLPRQRP